ncbi:hypothetical protein [Testudinibacter aquarius]|uniref:Uncharacterized protein n=1 Tax=Testudinibacter aquarius TaxID=1524974 RepID=A0A4R3YDP7_9PAST|nr:hypothetical protein [Testudinibacter aquarius]TCV89248.1 hypothetical protein EDC16_102125 [Testudinibacter aquarius]
MNGTAIRQRHFFLLAAGNVGAEAGFVNNMPSELSTGKMRFQTALFA